MPITLNCPCGKTLRVGDEYAGRRVKCPGCTAILTAPEPGQAFEVVDEPEPEKPIPDEDDKPGGYKVELAAETPEEDDDYDPYEDEHKQKKKREEKEKAKEKARKERRSVSVDSRPNVLRPEEAEEEERPRRRPRRREGVSDRAEVRRLAQGAGRAASMRRQQEARREAMFRIAYLLGGLIMTLAGIGVVVFGATSGGQDATLTMIVGGVVALCGLVALLQRFTGLLPDQ